MAVVRNLMVRIGADYSEMRKGMDGATSRLNQFARDTRRATSEIRGRKGIGGIGTDLKNLGRTVTDSLSQVSGAKGLGGITRALGGLKPALGVATNGLRGLGGAAGGASLAIGGLVAVLAVLTAGIYAASQRAVRFEADLGRLNMQLRGGSRDFMEWARSLGLARESAAQMGATYGTLLSSFLSGQEDLTNATKQLVQATRVTASATGRSIQDVMERMRSGLLGNTEAIEDLGIFVNVSMIESTKAFRRFAGDKSWEQLDFKMQQQIRLAAILEQTYDRYGDQLQDNVMTKQELLMEQLKDIQLNLSQAFLPIWDAVLPALTELASAVANVTENIARFSYWLRGWNYDERTSGMSDYNDSVVETGDSLDEMGEKAAKARSELAAFDRLNLLGFGKGSGGGAGGASGENGQFEPPSVAMPEEREVKTWYDTLIRRLNKYRPRIKFDPPEPPDAGMSGVLSRVISVADELAMRLRSRMAQMWSNLGLQTRAGLDGQTVRWGGFVTSLTAVTLPATVASVTAQWSEMWSKMRATTDSEAARTQLTWQTMLDFMLGYLTNSVPTIQSDWQKINESVRTVQLPLQLIQMRWQQTIDAMLAKHRIAVPEFQLGWGLIGEAIRALQEQLTEVRTSWSTTLQDMYTVAQQRVTGIVNEVQKAITALNNLRVASGQSVATQQPASKPATSTSSSVGLSGLLEEAKQKAAKEAEARDVLGNAFWANQAITEASKQFAAQRQASQAQTAPATSTSTSNRPAWVDETPILGDIYRGLDAFQQFTEPFAMYALQFTGGGGGAAGLLGKGAQWLQKSIKAIPAFAGGAVVRGPTLAMVGEYAGAINNPEVIGPLSEFEAMMDDGEQVAVLRQILSAIQRGQNVTVTISEDEIAGAAIRGHNKRARRIGRSELLI